VEVFVPEAYPVLDADPSRVFMITINRACFFCAVIALAALICGLFEDVPRANSFLCGCKNFIDCYDVNLTRPRRGIVLENSG